jgi:PAT family beta-lactamase induction signal transducer AmpG
VTSAALALVIAARGGWQLAYIACAAFAIPAMAVGLIFGEPARHRAATTRQGIAAVVDSVVAPLVEFFKRRGALLVLLFVLLHKMGDTLANLTFRLLFNDQHYTNDEIAFYDVGFGFWAYLTGIFIGGMLYTRIGMKRSVLASLVLMGVSNLSFAGLAGLGHSNWGLAGAIGFENLASGIGGVTVTAYLSALCDLRYTAAQYALLSAGASVVGRLLTGTSAGALIETLGYVNFYLLTTVLAVPAMILFWLMMRLGFVEASMGTAATTESTNRAATATPNTPTPRSGRGS